MNPKKITKEVLADLIADDEFGLFDVKARAKASTADELLVRRFNEIIDFIKENDRRPEKNPEDIGEFKLAARLEGINASEDYRERLADFDELGLLEAPKVPTTFEEIFADDEYGLYDNSSDILTLKHVPDAEKMIQRATPDEVAQREKCPDFEEFKDLFDDVHADLRSGGRTLNSFSSPNAIEQGKFFVMNGMLCYVAEITDERVGTNRMRDGRTRTIFENGTQSTMYVQSLARGLYDGGKIVTIPDDQVLERMTLLEDTKMGFVYVLRSLSEDPQLKQFADVHKIGQTRQAVSKRTSKAIMSTTFLNAGVDIVQEYEMSAAIVKDIEQMLHNFFARARLDIWFEKSNGKVKEANEWFDVPFKAIDQAITLIQNETITNHRYNPETRQIELV